MPEIEYEMYKGKYPTIKIPCGEYNGETQYVALGYKKAKAIVDHIDELEAFVIKCEERYEGWRLS